MSTPIVLLHGWGFTPAVWNPVINALVQQGFNHDHLLAPALNAASGDLTQSIDALARQLPERAHIVGWSLGGELALALATCIPQRLASLTMIASTPCFMNHDDWALGQPPSLLDDFDQRLAENPAALLKRFSMLIRHGDVAASRDRALTEELSQCNDSNLARLAAGLKLLRHIDLRAHMHADDVPTLLIHGTQDAVVPMAAAAWLAHKSHATLHEFEGASHALPLTHAPQIALYLLDFIEQNT